MKKIFVSIALVMFVGSISAPLYASNSKVLTEFKKDEKKRKKNKKGSCCAGKEGTAKTCSGDKSTTEKKSCHGHGETK